ncbi:ROK family transcriptional regulator [Demetria terragena]|uniref:ROK family transcriptional regulator n=1 Tax=Demetria terragena TaxID=63959 RepID=UPI00037609F3|nr:ROK family transcriptional regulator [Demetria terragena]
MGFGPGEVLDLIRRRQAYTRAQIAEVTGLSRVTVAQRVDALIDAGLISGAGEARSTGGRRATQLSFNADAGVCAVAALETTHADLALTDLGGAILTRARVEIDVRDGAAGTLSRVTEPLMRLLEGGPDRPLLGVGVSVPGPVDPVTERLSDPPILPGWDAFPIAETMTHHVDRQVPVVVRNDADAMAAGEYTAMDAPSAALLLVKVSTGIGAGMMINGEIFRGHDGAAGDIGHIRVPEAEDRVCRCGATGCLAAVASGRALASRLRDEGREVDSGRDVRELLAHGDPAATRMTREAGRIIGRVLATVVTMINPGTMLIGGDLASAALLSGIRESLYPAALPRATRHLTIDLAALGHDAGLVGMAQQVLHAELSADAVNRRLP